MNKKMNEKKRNFNFYRQTETLALRAIFSAIIAKKYEVFFVAIYKQFNKQVVLIINTACFFYK